METKQHLLDSLNWKLNYLATKSLISKDSKQIVQTEFNKISQSEIPKNNDNLTVKALYEFKGQQKGDLPFQKGEMITILEKKVNGDPGWWKGKVNGREGVFPSNFVQTESPFDDDQSSLPSNLNPFFESREDIISSSPPNLAQKPKMTHKPTPFSSSSSTTTSPARLPTISSILPKKPSRPKKESNIPIQESSEDRAQEKLKRKEELKRPTKTVVKALYDFAPLQSGDLGFKAGDKIIVTNSIDHDWWQGRVNKTQGQFPSNYVEPTTEPPNLLDFSNDDFLSLDKFAKETPETECSSIQTLTTYLIECLETPLDKYRAIFSWISFHISYDYDAFVSGKIGNQSAEKVFQKRKGVCAGYSNLFMKMCEYSDLNCRKILGHGKGIGSRPGTETLPLWQGSTNNHEWNVVFIENEYRFIDNTWGAGTIEGGGFKFKFSPFWFLTTPIDFIETHLPANPSDQYLNPIVSQQVFLRRPFAFSFFYEAGLKILPPNDTDYIKNVNNFVKIQILVPDTQFVCQNQLFDYDNEKKEHLKRTLSQVVQKDGKDILEIDVALPSKGNFILHINIMRGEVEPGKSLWFDRFLSFRITNEGNGTNHLYPDLQEQILAQYQAMNEGYECTVQMKVVKK